MNTNQKYDLYKKFLKTQPVAVVRRFSQEKNLYVIEIKYEINNRPLFVNAFINKVNYGATINDNKGKEIGCFNNPFFAKKLYEHGQKYL